MPADLYSNPIGTAEHAAHQRTQQAIAPDISGINPAATMGTRARQLALQNFSPKPIYDRLENLLLQCQGSGFRGPL